MPLDYIHISLLSVVIFLTIGFFLRSSYLIRQNAKNLDFLQRSLDEGGVRIVHKIDLVDRQLQDMGMDIKDLNVRTNIVETRLEERNAALLLSATVAPPAFPHMAPKRGRPRKNPEE